MIYSYRRVSTDEQVNGPQAQADAIRRWLDGIHQNGYNATIAGVKDFFDDGVSGSVPLYERLRGGDMGEALKKGDTIVVAKLDRLFRSVADAAVMIKEWSDLGVSLVAIAEGFDMTNPYGRAMAQMASVFAELEREMIRSRTKAALDSKRARGECVGTVPYGWNREGNQMVENGEEQRVIRDMRILRNTGTDCNSIAKAFNDLGITAKKGGKWHATQVFRVLKTAKTMKDLPIS